MKLEILEYLPGAKTNKPPLLFVHGAYQGAWCWEENFLPYFSSKGFASYALSFRGHGESEGFQELHSFTLKDYLEDVLETMTRLKTKPVLIGHSMGGAVVQKICHLYPEKVEAAVLMASNPPQGMRKEIRRMLFTSFRGVIKLARFNKGVRDKFPWELFFFKEPEGEKKEALLNLLQPESNKVRLEMFRPVAPAEVNNEVPVLVIGSMEDRWFNEKTTVSIARKYKAKTVIFPGIGHEMMLESNWKTVADEIIAFLFEIASS
ncbi:MAG: alpha/beta hydrolase [Peptococcaceae bacterium]|nr:alpha/beta hydrolase [Peptococcaceae bacterium]MDH7526008.1 alpha/beta hydrolase [Peptococcaceae bacterium]